MAKKSTADEARAAIDAAGGLMTLAEVSEAWGVTRQALAERIRRGTFPEPVKLAGRVPLYLRDDLEPIRPNRRYREGEPAPVNGQYAMTNARGESGGVLHQLAEGDPFPKPRRGYTWVLARTTRREIPPIRSLKERQGLQRRARSR